MGSAKMYLGLNTSVQNDTTGINTTLPITTANTLSCNALNISSAGDYSKFTVDKNGNVIADGTLYSSGSITAVGSLNASSLNLGSANNFTISSSGETKLQGDLFVGSNFSVTHGSGNVHLGGALYSYSGVSIGGTQLAPNLTLANSGHVTALGGLTIGSSDIVLNVTSGNASFKGDVYVGKKLSVNSEQFVIDSDNRVAKINCDATISGGLNMNSGNFTVAASDGSLVSKGSLTVTKDVNIGLSKVIITASSGDMNSTGSINLGSSNLVLDASDGSICSKGALKIGSDFALPRVKVNAITGQVETTFTAYVSPPSATDETSDLLNNAVAITTSTTSQTLVTQKYVDDAVWKQSARLNTILGTDELALQTFSNVFTIFKEIEGLPLADTITGMVNKTEQITQSISSVVANAYNPVLVNCTNAVWADAIQPFPIPWKLTKYPIFESLDGWWFRNLAAGDKVNWYLPANGRGMKMSSFINIHMDLFLVSTASLPWITVYTQPKGLNDHTSGLCNAVVGYHFSAPTIPNKHYCFYTGNDAPMNVFNTTAVPCTSTLTTNGLNKGNADKGSLKIGNQFDETIVSPDDLIQCFVIHTNSGASVGNVEFILNKFSIQENTGTTQMHFQNGSVASNYMFQSFYQKNHDFSDIGTKNLGFMGNYNTYVKDYTQY